METHSIYLADPTSKMQDTGGVGVTINKLNKEKKIETRADRLKILLSYHYFKTVELDSLLREYFDNDLPSVFIDSGGFSAKTQGVGIDMDGYIEFLTRYKGIITVYANLDEIGDAKLTYERQKRMEDSGLKPIPVFHTGENFAWLEKYITEGYKYIALGGMVTHSKNKKGLVNWISKCFKIGEEAGIGFHGFGMTSWDLMKAYPWKSVDSSSWCSGFRYGSVPLFDEKLGRFYSCNLRDIKGSYKYSSIIRSYGFSPNDIALGKEFDRIKIAIISAISFLKAEKWLNRRWLQQPISSDGALSKSVEREASPVQGGGEESLDRRSLQPVSSVSNETRDAGKPQTRKDAGDGGKNVYLVALPPKDGSEHNPDSKFVGGTQMFQAFKDVTGEKDG
jgi:hypothetical protein